MIDLKQVAELNRYAALLLFTLGHGNMFICKILNRNGQETGHSSDFMLCRISQLKREKLQIKDTLRLYSDAG